MLLWFEKLSKPLILLAGLIGLLVAIITQNAAGGFAPAQRPSHDRNPAMAVQGEPAEKLSRKQQDKLLKFRLEEMKQDAEELAGLAKSLQEDIDKTPGNVLSLQIVDKAEKIEKLAKKIKSAAKGF